MTELSRACILIIEKHVLIRNLISTILNNQGYLVLAAANDAEALEISRTFEGEIRLLISEGAGVVETVSAARPRIRIILLSKSTSSALREIAQTLHPAAFGQQAELPRKLRDCIHLALTDGNSGGALVEV